MADFAIWALLACLLLAFALIVPLTLALRRESGRRAGAETALALRAERIAMLDRRLAVIAPLDALWLGWQQGGRPPRDAVSGALGAMAETRLVFAAELTGELDALADLLMAYERQRADADLTFDRGHRYEREEALEREIALEQALKPTLAALRARLAEAARVPHA